MILNLKISDFNTDQIKDILFIEQQSQYSSWTEKMFLAELENKFSFFKIKNINRNTKMLYHKTPHNSNFFYSHKTIYFRTKRMLFSVFYFIISSIV